MTYHDILLKFTVMLENPIGGAAPDLTRRLNDWNDGRYPFPVEMLHKGLVEMLVRVAGTGTGGYVTEDGGQALAVVVQEEENVGKWRVLSRDDRQPNGAPGLYRMSRSRLFDDAEAAREWAGGISPSRFPIIIEAEKADMILAVLNTGIQT